MCVCARSPTCVWLFDLTGSITSTSVSCPCTLPACVLPCSLALPTTILSSSFLRSWLTSCSFPLIFTRTAGSKSNQCAIRHRPRKMRTVSFLIYAKNTFSVIFCLSGTVILSERLWDNVFYRANCSKLSKTSITNWLSTAGNMYSMCVLLQVTWFLCNVLQLFNCGW